MSGERESQKDDEGRPWWASEAAAGTAGEHPGGEVCQLCPFCALLRVLDDVRPEVVEHLTEAARHASLAAKAIVDAYASGFAPGDRLERIELDDEP